MNFPDAWATITGIAGILSLFLAINEKFSSWKKFTIPVCTSLVGFALGRLTIVVSHDTGTFSSENISIMILVFILLAVALAVFYIAMKYNYPQLAYLGMLFLIIIALPKVFDFYSSTKNTIPSGDYLVLSKYKEKVGDYEGAINYLQKYTKSRSDKEFNEQIKNMISDLRKKQLSNNSAIEVDQQPKKH